jgi:tetratricopeptide (TPR) repeat protein
MIEGKIKGLSRDPNSDDQYLVKIFMKLPELVHCKVFEQDKKAWIKAKLYFVNRRFAEAALLMIEILKVKNDPEITNFLARAIFFLGNPDLAVRKLKTIIEESEEKSPETLEALYLIGAIRYESHDADEERILSGINAWTQYQAKALLSKEEEQEIHQGLMELKSRLPGQALSKTLLDPFAPQARYSEAKNAIMQAFSQEKLLLALELSQEALKKNYDEGIATVKARLLFKTGKITEAAQIFADIVAKSPTYAPAFHYQGMVFMFLGKPKEAILSWQKVILLDEAYARAHNLKQRIDHAQKMSAQEPTR